MIKKKFDIKGLDLVSLQLKAVVEIQNVGQCHEVLYMGKSCQIMQWKRSSSLVPPSANSTYHWVLIVTLINPTNINHSIPYPTLEQLVNM